MMKLSKGDFVEIDYTAKTVEGSVFDTTIYSVAEKEGLLHEHKHDHDHEHGEHHHHEDEKEKYKPIIACIGERHVLKGLDDKLAGLPVGKHGIKLSVEEAFGKKSAKLLRLIPMNVFNKQGIKPFIGLELNIDNQLGIVRNISGGRVIVDFNHPLSGKEIIYELEIKRKVDSPKEKLEGLLRLLGVQWEGLSVSDSGKTASIYLKQEVPSQYLEFFSKDVERLTGLKPSFKLPGGKEFPEKKISEEKKEGKQGEAAPEKKSEEKK